MQAGDCQAPRGPPYPVRADRNCNLSLSLSLSFSLSLSLSLSLSFSLSQNVFSLFDTHLKKEKYTCIRVDICRRKFMRVTVRITCFKNKKLLFLVQKYVFCSIHIAL